MVDKSLKRTMNQKGGGHLVIFTFVVVFGLVGLLYLTYTRASNNLSFAPITGVAKKCVDNRGNQSKSKNPVQLYTCNKHEAQLWALDPSGQLVNKSGWCMTASGTSNQSLIVLDRCDSEDTKKIWTYEASSKTIQNKASGKCVDSKGGSTQDKNPLVLYTCNGKEWQKWNVTVAEPLPAIASFSASPATININDASKLAWTGTGFAKCSVTPGGPVETTSLSWTTPVQKKAGTITYTLSCKNKSGATAMKTASLNVQAATTPPSTNNGQVVFSSNLTTEPIGTTYTTGVRTTDQSYNRKSQVTYDSNGMTITAERTGGTIYSADVMMRGIKIPKYHAIEADVTLSGYLGVGMFPAMWERPTDNGTGELDIWEYAGAYAGKDNEWKMTAITTPYGSGQKQAVDRFAPRMPSRTPIGQKIHWRMEKTKDTAILYMNGKQIAKLDKALYDKTNPGDNRWSQFEEDKTWYPRFTYQVGVGANANLAGPVPTSWVKSQMTVTNLRVYKL